MKQKNQGVLIIDLTGTELTEEEKALLQHPGVAGVLLFARNYSDRVQLCQLVSDIRAARENLVIMVDQEGGRVQRFKQDFTRLPAPEKYLRYYHRDPQGAIELVQDCGWLMAQELLSCGVDLSLAPVLDINHGLTPIVGDRAFGTDSETVIKLASAWMEGMTEAGMAAVGKHFPGHGNVQDDSHLTLPVDDRSFEEIAKEDLEPFKTFIEKGIQGVMPAHIVFSQIDSLPAGFSAVWLKDILREKLGYEGCIISDCLTMEGAASAGSFTARTERALTAGCDLLLLSSREGVIEVLPWLVEQGITSDKADTFKAQSQYTLDELSSMDRYLSCKDRLEHLSERYS